MSDRGFQPVASHDGWSGRLPRRESPLLAVGLTLGLSAVAVAAGGASHAGPAAEAAGFWPAPQEGEAVRLVASAPGHPGTTEGAQETMDAFAAMLADAAGREPGSVSAVYEEEEQEGVRRIADPATGLALVPLPFLLKHGDDLDLQPLLQVVQESGSATEEWSLVAAAGRLDDPGSLAGWRVEGIPAYAPAFVRGPVLGTWGNLPENVEIAFQPRVLSALRGAARGDDVAVLLDRAQTAALDELPLDADLEVVATSPPLPAALLVAVGDRVADEALEDLLTGLRRVHEEPRFAEVLGTLRLSRFTEVDVEALERARDAYLAAAGS